MRIRLSSIAVFPLLLACDGAGPMEAPEPPTVVAVSPEVGAVDVDPGARVVVTFSQPMADGAEAYMDVHQGGPEGAVVAGRWSWGGDRRTATFAPSAPMAAGTPHTVHLGAGLQGRHGGAIDLDHCVGLGGTWMGGAGTATGGPGGGWNGHHGSGWMHRNGSWGMGFGFATGGGHGGPGTGPGAPGTGADSATAIITAVSPKPGATGVDLGATVVVSFGAPMPDAAALLMDVHVAGFGGDTVAGDWAWSDDGRVATFTPAEPLLPLTRYAVHIGGGVVTADGVALDFQHCHDALGGQWAGGTGGMAGGPHHGAGSGGSGAGASGGHAGSGWQHANGSYGVVFAFTTGGG